MSGLQIGGRTVTAMTIDGRAVTGLHRDGVQIWPAAAVDVEAGLTLTASLAAGAQDAAFDPFNSQDAVFATTTTIPAAAGGVLMEHGGGGRGMIVCMTTATTLRVRAGDGANPPNLTNAAILDVDVSAFQDGRPHRLVWDVRPAGVARLRLWIDGALQGEAFTSDNTALEDNQWSGGGTGGFVTGSNANLPGEPSGPWVGVMASGTAGELALYGGQLAAA